MTRRISLGAIAAGLICMGLASAASAAVTTQLTLGQGEAFAILGHSCGGIQEHAYATGFGAGGFPTGDVYLQTRCGGSGRGGGYKTTTYTAWATVTWDWYGETRSYGKLSGSAEVSTTFSAEDEHHDRVYNTATSAYLETVEPPAHPPAAPSNVSAYVGLYESGESEYLRMSISWSEAPETAGLISSSTVTATPVPSGPALSATVSGTAAAFGPVSPNTTYRITVTSTDAEGTSEASTPIEITTPNQDGEAGGGANAETCEQNSGTIKLSPGLTNTPQVQTIKVKGTLKSCDGPAEPTEGTYSAELTTSEAVTCSTLTTPPGEAATIPVSLTVKWSPKEAGVSHGSLALPLSEVGASLHGTFEGGPFATPQSVTAASLGESFTGGPSCGVPSAKGVVKPVKSGTFSTSAVKIG